MISLLQSIVDCAISLVAFVVHTFESLINLILHIPTYQSFFITSISFMPSIIIPFAVASISLYIVLFIINRKAT